MCRGDLLVAITVFVLSRVALHFREVWVCPCGYVTILQVVIVHSALNTVVWSFHLFKFDLSLRWFPLHHHRLHVHVKAFQILAFCFLSCLSLSLSTMHMYILNFLFNTIHIHTYFYFIVFDQERLGTIFCFAGESVRMSILGFW